MPRCRVSQSKSRPGSRAAMRPANSARSDFMRATIAPTSSCQPRRSVVVGQQAGDDRRAMVGRHRVHAPCQPGLVRRHRRARRRIGRDQPASAPVRSRYRPKFFEQEIASSSFRHARRQRAQADGVRLEVVAEALVGQVDERHQAALRRRRSASAAIAAATGRRPVGLWQQACSSTTDAGRQALELRQHARRRRRGGARRRSTGSARAAGRNCRPAVRGWPRSGR